MAKRCLRDLQLTSERSRRRSAGRRAVPPKRAPANQSLGEQRMSVVSWHRRCNLALRGTVHLTARVANTNKDAGGFMTAGDIMRDERRGGITCSLAISIVAITLVTRVGSKTRVD